MRGEERRGRREMNVTSQDAVVILDDHPEVANFAPWSWISEPEQQVCGSA